MAAQIEIDSPIPGDIVGTTFVVFGTYTLTPDVTLPPSPLPPPPVTLTGTIMVTARMNQIDGGGKFPEGSALGEATMVQNPLSITATEGADQPWSVTFQFNDTSYNDCKIEAKIVGTAGSDNDSVEEVDIRTNAFVTNV